MTRSQAEVTRLLSLVPYLRAHPGVPLSQVAEVFGVRPARIVSDLKTLWMCGLPGGLPDDLIDIDMDAVDDDGTVTIGNADALPRPMRLTPDEAWSLLAALQVVGDLADPSVRPAVDSAIATLRTVVPQVGPDPVQASSGAGSDQRREWFGHAIAEGWRVRLVHRREETAEPTTPVVDPARVEVREGHSYLLGWSLERKAWRTWRLDRIERADQVGMAARHGRPPVDLQWFSDLPASDEVTVTLAPSAGWVAEYHPTRRVEKLADRWRVTFAVASAAWLADLLIALGPEVYEVTPERAAIRAARLLRSAARANGLDEAHGQAGDAG